MRVLFNFENKPSLLFLKASIYLRGPGSTPHEPCRRNITETLLKVSMIFLDAKESIIVISFLSLSHSPTTLPKIHLTGKINNRQPMFASKRHSGFLFYIRGDDNRKFYIVLTAN